MKLRDLNALCEMDDRLCQVARDPDQIRFEIHQVHHHLQTEQDAAASLRMVGWLADAHRVIGQFDAAEEYARHAVARSRVGDDATQVAMLIRLGEVLRCAGRPDDAIPILEEASGLAVGGASSSRHFALQHLGNAAWNANQIDLAREALTAALREREALGDEMLISQTQAVIDRLPS